MSIFKTAYDTTACSGYRIKDTNDKLKLANLNNSLKTINLKFSNFENSFNLKLVEGGNSTADTIPYFNHPIININEEVDVLIDVRNFGKWYTPQSKFIVRNNPEYSWNVMRGALNYIWVDERVELLRDVSILPSSVYAALISECVSRKYALDPAEQIVISVVACYYYNCLFTDENEFNENDLNRLSGNIARATKVPSGKVFDIISDMKVIHSLEEMCEAFKEKSKSIRLDDFNVGVLLAIVSGNWFGTNARENLAVGLEHVPTWLMICYASLNEATFKRSVLAKLVERFAKGGTGENFVKSIDTILDKTLLFTKLNGLEY